MVLLKIPFSPAIPATFNSFVKGLSNVNRKQGLNADDAVKVASGVVVAFAAPLKLPANVLFAL